MVEVPVTEVATKPPTPRRRAEPERTLTYELVFDTGHSIRIDIPSTYKITFGPVAGAKGVERGGGGFAFRAWEAETRQRLLFTSVASFRDVSLTMKVRAVRRFGSDLWFPDDGSWIGARADLVTHAWMSPDEMTDRDPAEQPDPGITDDDDYPKARLRGMSPRANRSFTVGSR